MIPETVTINQMSAYLQTLFCRRSSLKGRKEPSSIGPELRTVSKTTTGVASARRGAHMNFPELN